MGIVHEYVYLSRHVVSVQFPLMEITYLFEGTCRKAKHCICSHHSLLFLSQLVLVYIVLRNE